jgi:hypothetical protein
MQVTPRQATPWLMMEHGQHAILAAEQPSARPVKWDLAEVEGN